MFDLSKVTNVYSGRKGCACGCRGKYSYATRFAHKRPSYYDGDQGINDRNVTAMTNKVTRLLSDQNAPVDRVFWTDSFVAVDLTNDRTYTLYFSCN